MTCCGLRVACTTQENTTWRRSVCRQRRPSGRHVTPKGLSQDPRTRWPDLEKSGRCQPAQQGQEKEKNTLGRAQARETRFEGKGWATGHQLTERRAALVDCAAGLQPKISGIWMAADNLVKNNAARAHAQRDGRNKQQVGGRQRD